MIDPPSFLILLDNPYLIWVFIISIAWVFFDTVRSMEKEYSSVVKSLARIVKSLEAITLPVGNKEFRDIEALFLEADFLKAKWYKFKAGLVDFETVAPIESFFPKASFYQSVTNASHIPSILTAIGLLGTFIFIVVGLSHLSVSGKEVEGIDGLINGLSNKFYTSIAGLIASICVILYQNEAKQQLNSQLEQFYNAMDNVFPRYSMEKRLSNLAEQLQKQQDFEPLLQAVRELSTNIKENGNTQILSNLGKLTEAVSSGFTQTNNSLNKAIETLAKGATEQVIEALKQVITDFNSNLTEQFGENFKHLNQAVFKLVEWQENYKTTLEEVQNALNLSLDSIETTDATLKSIASRNADILKVHENLGALLSLLNNQSEEAQERLQDYNQLHKDSSALLVQIKQQLQSTETSAKNSFQKMTTDLDVVLSNSVDKLEKHNKATNDLVYNSFVETMQALDTISVKIQNALTKQSENMASLTETLPEHSRQLKNSSDEIQRQLEQSLSQMQTVLVGITNKFAEVYETSLKRPFVESQ